MARKNAAGRAADASDRTIAGTNSVRIEGQVSVPPRVRELESGTVLATVLVRVPGRPGTYTSIPVTVWDPGDDVLALAEGDVVEVEAVLHRRFWADQAGRRVSRLEVEARTVRRTA